MVAVALAIAVTAGVASWRARRALRVKRSTPAEAKRSPAPAKGCFAWCTRKPQTITANIGTAELGWAGGKLYYRPLAKANAFECEATSLTTVMGPDGRTTTTVQYTLKPPVVAIQAEGRTVNPLVPGATMPKGTGVFGIMGANLHPVEVASFTATDVGLLTAAHCVGTLRQGAASDDIYVSTRMDSHGLRVWTKLSEKVFGCSTVRVRYNGYRDEDDTMTSRDLALLIVPDAFYAVAGVQVLRRLRFTSALTGPCVASSPFHTDPTLPASHGFSDGKFSHPPSEWRDDGVGEHDASTLPGSSGAMLWSPGANPTAVGVHIGSAGGVNWYVNGPTASGFLRSRQEARLLKAAMGTISARAAAFLHAEGGSVTDLTSPPEGGAAKAGYVDRDDADDLDLGRAAPRLKLATGIGYAGADEEEADAQRQFAARDAANAAFQARHRRRGTAVPEVLGTHEFIYDALDQYGRHQDLRLTPLADTVPHKLRDPAMRDAVTALLALPEAEHIRVLHRIHERYPESTVRELSYYLTLHRSLGGRFPPASFMAAPRQPPVPEPPAWTKQQANTWRDTHIRLGSAEARSPLSLLVSSIVGAPGLDADAAAAPQEPAPAAASRGNRRRKGGVCTQQATSTRPQGTAPELGSVPELRPATRKVEYQYGPKPADKAAHPLPAWATEPKVVRDPATHSEGKEFKKATTVKPRLVPHSRPLPGRDGTGRVHASSCTWTPTNPLPPCGPDVATMVTQAVADAVAKDDYNTLAAASAALRRLPPCDITALPVFASLRSRRTAYGPTTAAKPSDHLTPVFGVSKPIQVDGAPGRELDAEETKRYVALGGTLGPDGLPEHALPDRSNAGKLASLKYQLDRKAGCLPDLPWNMARLYEYAESWPKDVQADDHLGGTTLRWRKVLNSLKLEKSPAASSIEFDGTDKADMIDKNPLLMEVAWLRVAALLLFDPAVLDDCSPALLMQMGLRDPSLLFTKDELHKRSKVRTNCWRAIWDISLVDELVQRYFHDATNKADIAAYQAGKALTEEHPLFGCTSGMGHHDEGFEVTLALMRRLLAVEGKLASADASGWDITVTRMHKFAAAYIRASQHGWSPGKVGPHDLLLRGLLNQAILSTAHCVLIGRTVYQVDLLGIQASGESSTSGDNNRGRGSQVYCLTGAPNMTQGDDLVTSRPLTAVDVENFRRQGTLISDYAELVPGEPVGFTSHFYDLESGVVTFGNWPKMAARLALTSELTRLRENPGVAAGVRGCLRHTPDALARFEDYLRDHGVGLPEPDEHFNLRHLCY